MCISSQFGNAFFIPEEQRWRPGVRAISGLSWLLVLYSATKDFFSAFFGFPLFSKIHLIPKWRPINYSFVCMLISPLCLVSTYKTQKNFAVKMRKKGLMNNQTKEQVTGRHFGIRCINISKFQFDRMQDLTENHFRVSGSSWVNINNDYYMFLIFCMTDLLRLKIQHHDKQPNSQ